MTHSFAVYAKNPLGDDENVWQHKICCHKSRPKSLEMRRDHIEARNQFTPTSTFLPSLKVLVLKNKQNCFKSPKVDEPVKYIDGSANRPLTWGPNGSNFRDVIALFTDFDESKIDVSSKRNSSITSSRILDDVTNNNIQTKTVFPSKNDDETIKLSPGISCTDRENTDEEMKWKISKDTPPISQTKQTSLSSDVGDDQFNSLRLENVDKLVEELVNSMINEIVRSEAIRKSQQLFQANEMKLEKNLQSRMKGDKVQQVLLWLVDSVVQIDYQMTSSSFESSQKTLSNDDGPYMDQTERLKAKSTNQPSCETVKSNLPEISSNPETIILLTHSQSSIVECVENEASFLHTMIFEENPHPNEFTDPINSELIPTEDCHESIVNENQIVIFEEDTLGYRAPSVLVVGDFEDKTKAKENNSDCLNDFTIEEECLSNGGNAATEVELGRNTSSLHNIDLKHDKNAVNSSNSQHPTISSDKVSDAAADELATIKGSITDVGMDLKLFVEELLNEVEANFGAGVFLELDSTEDTPPNNCYDLERLADFSDGFINVGLRETCSTERAVDRPTAEEDTLAVEEFQQHCEQSCGHSETYLRNFEDANQLSLLDTTLTPQNIETFASDDGMSIKNDSYLTHEDDNDDSNDADGEDFDEDDDQKDFEARETNLFDEEEMFETTLGLLVTHLNDSETMSETLVEDDAQPYGSATKHDDAIQQTFLLHNAGEAQLTNLCDVTIDANLTSSKSSSKTDLIVNSSKTTTNEDVTETKNLHEDYNASQDAETIANTSDNTFNETVSHEQFKDNTKCAIEDDNEILNEKQTLVSPKRPTTLFTRKSLDNFKALGFFKNLTSGNLTPVQDNSRSADVYSEATEKVLEEDKTLRRQASFTKQYPPVRYRPKIKPSYLQKLDHLEELESDEHKDEFDDSDDCNSPISDTELIFRSTAPDVPVPGPTCHCFEKKPFVMQSKRSRSLPFSIKTDYHDIINFSPLDLSFDDHFRYDTNAPTPTTPQFLPYLLNVDEDANKRDSALSRESAASSGTVVASEDEEYEAPENRELLSHLNKTSKYSPSTQSPLTLEDVSDAARLRRKCKMERSQSLDRQNRNSRRFAKYSNPVSVIHQSNCGMMLSAPSITVTRDCNGVHPGVPQFDPTMSSSQSLASSSSYMGDESDILRSSSMGSSPLSSPTGSPKLTRKSPKIRQKSKILTHRSTKHAERQAAEACEWLKAAGFPQYVQLYEDGNFPVDIASVSSDHDFLKQELIAALVRRLNILNKCANLKLDKITSKEGFADNEEEEFEQYALSDFWRFEEDGRRWSRLDSKASSVGSPTFRSSNSGQKQTAEGLPEDSNGDVFTKDDTLRPITNENGGSDEKLNQTGFDQPRLVPNKTVHLKPKTHSFLKRVGGDLKKIGSFRRKESPRPTIVDISLDDSWAATPPSRTRHKSLRKNRAVTISKPVLQGGHEKFEHMKCTTIDISPTSVKELQNQHRGRKPSSHSLMSSSSSSGGASSISTPASRRTRASTEDFSSDFGELSPGIYNRNRLPAEQLSNSSLRSKDLSQDKDSSLFVMPRDYKPGTFPAALRERYDDDTSSISTPPVSLPSRSRSVSEASQSAPRPMSIYDNLPDNAFGGHVCAHDIIKIMDPGSPVRVGNDSDVYMGSLESLEVGGAGIDPAFWSVDDIVEHTQNLQQMVGSWGVGDDDENEKVPSIDSLLNEPSFTSSDNLPSYNADNISNIEDDSDTTSLTSSEHRSQLLLRWEPLNRENFDSSTAADNLQLHTLSAGQLMMLRRLSMLKLTARMEQYTLSNSKGALSWSVPRFIRRMKVPDYKDKTVFGVPLLHNIHRSGQPLPICIQHALAYLRRTALDQVGLFRKPGVRGRIHKLRALCETNPDMELFEDCSAYDVADLIKQYFRELPDPLMTMKMSDTFVGIFLHVPENLQLQTLQTAIMLLPDENRETLKTLLHFLADVASNYSENHMNASNLSTCFAPSLFYQQLGNLRLMASTVSPKVKKSQGGKSVAFPGKPDIKAMSENKASNQCLAFMIKNVKNLFKISEDAMTQCRMSVMQQTEDVLATEIGYKSDYQDEKDYYADFHSYVDRIIRQTLREEQRYNQNRGWQSLPAANGCEIACKKMNDGNPLRMWRSQVEISGAEPGQIMDRILNERHLWDNDLLQWKVLQQPDDRTQLFQLVRAEMSPQPTRDYCVLRSWRNDVNSRGASAIVEVSTGQHPLLGDVRGVILTSRYLIEPTEVPNKCIVTHMCRVDTKGRNPEWYNKAYGHVVALYLSKIRDSVRTFPPKMTSLTAC